ncbi:MAG: DUF2200 domain-containing protein [Flavobacteriaceae bacterium]|nr:DUF2200 domain-containing protein [Flavobacteriaceae bacterium]MDH3796367.1 DUF2200 domain-containing protein [Flavobacteriaceae bacterium]
MTFSSIYPIYLNRLEKHGRTKDVLHNNLNTASLGKPACRHW